MSITFLFVLLFFISTRRECFSFVTKHDTMSVSFTKEYQYHQQQQQKAWREKILETKGRQDKYQTKIGFVLRHIRGGEQQEQQPAPSNDDNPAKLLGDVSLHVMKNDEDHMELDDDDNDDDDDDDDEFGAEEVEVEAEEEEEEIIDVVPVPAEIVEDEKGTRLAWAATQMQKESDIVNASIKESKEQQSRSYFLSSILWLSIAIDSILNKSKQQLIFPSTTSTTTTAASAAIASLSTGFLLASTISFLLSRNIEQDDIESSSFLISIRKRFHLALTIFGSMNLCAQIIASKSSSAAPYLGMSGAVINAHNSLIAYNGWRKECHGYISDDEEQKQQKKESMLIELFQELIRFIQSFLRPIMDKTKTTKSTTTSSSSSFYAKRLKRIVSTSYMLAAYSMIVRAIQAVRNIFQKDIMVTTTAASMSIDTSKQMILQWAGLARYLLAIQVALSLKDAVDKNHIQDNMFIVLNGICSILSFAVALSMTSSNSSSSSLDSMKLFGVFLLTGSNALWSWIQKNTKNNNNNETMEGSLTSS